MTDARVAKLAGLLVNYSLQLQPGETVRINGGTVAAPLVTELYRAALRAGAHPRPRIQLEGLDVISVSESSEEQLTFVSELDRLEVEQVDAVVTIWGDRNTRSLGQTDPQRLTRQLGARRVLVERFYERVDKGEAKWVGTRFPTDGHAQDADMSLAEYEDFVYGACHVRDGEDPVAHWSDVSRELGAHAQTLGSVGELRILGPDTDLRLGREPRVVHGVALGRDQLADLRPCRGSRRTVRRHLHLPSVRRSRSDGPAPTASSSGGSTTSGTGAS
jgi:aminopeptidase